MFELSVGRLTAINVTSETIGGAGLLTLDEIYKRAKSDWLKKREDTQSYLETGNNGMISLCGYVSDGCMDDCFIGITISYIEKL